jgi:hypothetical protein
MAISVKASFVVCPSIGDIFRTADVNLIIDYIAYSIYTAYRVSVDRIAHKLILLILYIKRFNL